MAVKPISTAIPESRSGHGGVTLKDVAALAHVSTAVASTVLSGTRTGTVRVAPDTQLRVLNAAQVLGYRSRRTHEAPVRLARHNGAGTSFPQSAFPALVEVGVIASFIPDPADSDVQNEAGGTVYDDWGHELTTNFELAVSEGTRSSVTHYCNRGRHGNTPLPMDEAIAQIIAQGVNAIALIEFSSSSISPVARCIPLLESTGLPFVLVSTDAVTAPIANVYFDGINGGYRAASHLIDQGYREICFFAPDRVLWVDERIEGAREAVHYAGLPPEALRVLPIEEERVFVPPFDARVRKWNHETSAYEAGKLLLEREGVPPIAMIAANDGTAVGFIKAAEERGFHAGVDFAIVGFDGAPRFRPYNLTTLRQPREAMGREAARLLLRQIAGDATARQQVRLNMHLLVRGSTPRATLIASRRRES